MQLNYKPTAKHTLLNTIQLNEVLKQIQTPNQEEKETLDIIQLILNYYSGQKSKYHKTIKNSHLPVYYFNCTFNHLNNGAKKNNVLNQTNYLFFDIDDLNGCDIEVVKTQLMKLPFVYSVWKSASQQGLSFLIKISQAQNMKSNDIFRFIDNVFLNDFKTDTNAYRWTQCCFQGYDTNIYINESVEPLNFTNQDVIDWIKANPIVKENESKNDESKPITLDNKVKKVKNSIIEIKQEDEILTQNILNEIIDWDNLNPNDERYFIIDNNSIYLNEGYFNNRVFQFIPSQIKKGTRKYTLYKLAVRWYSANMISYNQANKASIKSMLIEVNQRCTPPLPIDIIDTTIEIVEKQYKNKHINFNYLVNRKVLFNPKAELTAKQKKSSVCKAIAIVRKEKTKSNIIKALRDLYVNNVIPTNENIADKLKISVRTVRTYLTKSSKDLIIKELKENNKIKESIHQTTQLNEK